MGSRPDTAGQPLPLAYDGSPPLTRVTFPACCAHYPGGSNGCWCRLLPRSHGLPRVLAGSASALWISRPAQASLALRPAGSLDRQKRPLSRGFGPSGCPSKPLVSYQINRQLSGRNPPPLVTRAFGAHQNEANFRGWAPMTSFRQIDANRRNARKSTGPTAEEGKHRSRCNAVRHGLAAEFVEHLDAGT